MGSRAVNITQQESIAISFIRVFAMCLIIACHFTQAYGHNVAFLLNVGVQLFFLTSGFLYGKIEISNSWEFYKKRITKVYVPYIFFVSLILLLQGLLGTWQFNFRDIAIYVLNLQGFLSTSVDGLNHLWFLSVLMICYLITPLLQRLFKWYPWWLFAVVVVSIVEFVFIKKMYSTCAWILLYTAGMTYGQYSKPKVSLSIMITAAVFLAALFPFFNLDRLLDSEWAHYNIWLHCVLAAFIFSSLYYAIPKRLSEDIMSVPVLKQIDTISYEVYLVHHPLIMGPLALLTITPYAGLNIAIILLISLMLPYIFVKLYSKL